MPTDLSPDFPALVDRARLNLAADSLAKASTPEPFSKSKTSNWVAKNGGLPAYIQHVAHGIQKDGKTESEAISMAIGIVKKWAAGGKGVDKNTQAAAAKAVAEWEALKAKNKATNASAVTDEEHLALMLAVDKPVGPLPGETPINENRYLLALSAARRQNLAVFEESKHPRLHAMLRRELAVKAESVAHRAQIVEEHVGKVEGLAKGQTMSVGPHASVQKSALTGKDSFSVHSKEGAAQAADAKTALAGALQAHKKAGGKYGEVPNEQGPAGHAVTDKQRAALTHADRGGSPEVPSYLKDSFENIADTTGDDAEAETLQKAAKDGIGSLSAEQRSGLLDVLHSMVKYSGDDDEVKHAQDLLDAMNSPSRQGQYRQKHGSGK